tara:strand:+ start:268 stop:483 length:216 start_codon:yes stop_codon:yes gene_type:complete
LIIWDICVGKNGLDWAFGDACSAIDTFVGINDEVSGQFSEGIYGANCNAILVFVIHAGGGNNMCHDDMEHC